MHDQDLAAALVTELDGSFERFVLTYCYPTCRHAHRMAERHRVSLRSAREATAMGYRPCTVCRPPRAA